MITPVLSALISQHLCWLSGMALVPSCQEVVEATVNRTQSGSILLVFIRTPLNEVCKLVCGRAKIVNVSPSGALGVGRH